MPVHRPGSRDPMDMIQADINSAHKGVSGIRRQMKRPTIPVYDSTAFPTDPQRGQIVRDINDPTILWVYGEDDTWHEVGGGANIPYAAASVDTLWVDSGVTTKVPFAPTLYPSNYPPYINPRDNSGLSYFKTNSDTYFNTDGLYDPFNVKGIHVKNYGFYVVTASCTWPTMPTPPVDTTGVLSIVGDNSMVISLIGGSYQKFMPAGKFGTQLQDWALYDLAPTDTSSQVNISCIVSQNSGASQRCWIALFIMRIANPFAGFRP